jgi:hypothetical protein
MIIAGSVAVMPRVDGGESVYAADGWTLREFDGATGNLRGVYSVGCNPTSVSVDGEQLVLSSWLLGNAVQVWDPQTQQTVEDYGAFARPVDAIRFQGALVVVDLGYGTDTAQVAMVSPEDPNQIITLAEGLDVPRGLAATEDDLWVSDWGSGSVFQLAADGELLSVPVPVATGLAGPEGIAVGPDGNLLVIETEVGQLSHIDLASGTVTILVQELELGLPGSPAFPPGHIYNGIAVSPTGKLYITSDINNQLLSLHCVDPTLVAHWALDEAEGNIAHDSIIENKGFSDGYLLGDPIWQPTGGQINGALLLDGIDDCAVAGSALNPADGPFSVFAWIQGGAPGQVIVSQQGAADWLSANAEGNLMTELKASGRSGGPLQSQTIITDGHWHRIGFVWDGLNRSLYVDDILVAEDTQDSLEGSNNGLYIGTGTLMTPGTFWSGMIDDVRIYNRAISP